MSRENIYGLNGRDGNLKFQFPLVYIKSVLICSDFFVNYSNESVSSFLLPSLYFPLLFEKGKRIWTG